MDFPMQLLPPHGALHGDWLADRDRSGASVGVKVKSRVRRQHKAYGARPGMHVPRTRRTALGRNCPTAGLSLKRSMDTAQFHTAGTSVGAYRARRGLLQGNSSATGVSLESPGYIGRAN